MGKKNKRIKGFLDDVPEWWEKHWQDMPEFKQEDLSQYKTVYIHFKNKKDMKAFSELINQKISFKTKSLWYPEVKPEKLINKLYIDES